MMNPVRRLSFRAVRNVGVGVLLAILLGTIGFSYLTSERSLDASHRMVHHLLAAHETLIRVNDFLRAANQSFAVYIRRDRISKETVLKRFDLLQSNVQRILTLSPPDGWHGNEFALVDKARTAFLYYLDEENIDPAADAASAYLRQIGMMFADIRRHLQRNAAGAQGTAGTSSLDEEIITAGRILGATELDLQRYVDRERIVISDILFPVRRAEELLAKDDVVWADMPPDTMAARSDLVRSLQRYQTTLHHLAEEERVSGEAIYPEFERNVNEAAGDAELALITLNQMMSRHLVDNEARHVALGGQQQQVLLAFGAVGVFLAVGVSLVLGRALSSRLQELIAGTRQIGKGSWGYRLETGVDDEIGRLATAFNDMISELERKEEALQRHIGSLDAANRAVLDAKQDLEWQIFKRTRELRTALDEARLANQAKDEFLAKVSHEIRTPLNGVLGMADVLLHSELSERQRRMLRSLRQSGEVLTRIIDDILDFSRIKSGRLELKKSKFDPVATIESTIDIIARSAQAKGLEFVYYLPADFPEDVEGDPDRLRQILLNLLGNAVKFTEQGEVTLHGAVERDAGGDAILRFEVRDTGIGIPEQAHGRIFDAFTQADDSSTRRFTGTGLGLTIAKQLVEAMGGEIGFSSMERSGSRFWFTLPVGKAPRNDAPQSEDVLLGRRILIAEKNSSCREVLARLVDEIGCVSDSVDSGRAALARLGAMDTHPPYDAVLVDVSLSDLGGLEVAEKYHRQLSDTALPIPFILMIPGALGDGASASDLISATVEKPVRREVLRRVLCSVIEKPVSTESKPPPREEAKPLRHLRVLVAEDNPVSQEVMRHLLEGLGCQVELACDGRQALEAFERTPFNIVLLDCQMPEVDGYEVASEIRQREGARQRTPLVALTASAMESDHQHCLAVGMDDYLTKPVNENILRETLSRWCGSSHVQ
jgi:signal transduction histidine kinase/CheY-like chemotaxis protein